MSRPSDWYVVDQPSDPTPGESFGVRALAGTYGDLAATAADAHRTVQAVRQASGGDTWIGKAAEAFRSKLESLPADLDKCADSYEVARDSMKSWASSIETHQFKADKGLADGRAAQHDLSAARSALTSALGTQTNASQSFDKTNQAYQKSQAVAPASAVPPTASSSAPSEADVRRAATARDQADSAVGSAQSSMSAAQSRLDIAKRLVLEARSGYESDARVVVAKLDHAKDVGIRADSWWESVYHSDAWHVVVAVATVAVVVLAVAALIVTGPIGLLVGGAALLAGGLLLANDAAAVGEGDESPAEFAAMAALSFIPGGRAARAGLSGLRAGTEAVEGTAMVARGVTAEERIARSTTSVRSAQGTTRTRALAASEQRSAASASAGSPPADATAGGGSLPTVVFSRARAPRIADNFDAAVADGAPTRLTRATSDVRDANRTAALRGQPRAPKGQSLDEYPFASSVQGGPGARVAPVPVSEQNYQGGTLRGFYQKHGIQPGDDYHVRFDE